jgi:hypothetical protein
VEFHGPEIIAVGIMPLRQRVGLAVPARSRKAGLLAVIVDAVDMKDVVDGIAYGPWPACIRS